MNATDYSVSVANRKKEPPNDRARWARRVREETARMSQEGFADALGVARPTVSNWERGKHPPEWASIDKIMRRFPTAIPPPFVPTREELLQSRLEGMTDEGLEVAEYLNPLPDVMRKELRDAIHRLVQLRLARGQGREAK